jgi:hypothetical protein
MFRSSAYHNQGAYLILVKIRVFMYGELGYAAAYVHLFCVLFTTCKTNEHMLLHNQIHHT